jgi:flavorubredoxin
MHAVVVYESHWGNTETVARSIAEGIGPGTTTVTTDEAVPEIMQTADLIVAGAPVMGFRLSTPQIVDSLAREDEPPKIHSTSMRTWLKQLRGGHGAHATFETRIWWSPGGATGAIDKAFASAGYRRISEARRFVVKGKYGPLRDGELERAREWGTELATAMTEPKS